MRARPRRYSAGYWDNIRGDELPRDISIALFDTAVNFHPKTAIQMLQKILKVKQDGRMGPDTLEAVRNYKGDLVEEFLRARLQAHEDDVKKNKEQEVHIRGWRDRVARLRHYLRPEARSRPAGKNPYAPPAGNTPPYADESPPASGPFSAFSCLDLPGRPNALGPIPPMWDPGALPTGPNRLAGDPPMNLPPGSANQPFQYSPSGMTGPSSPAQPASVSMGYHTWPLPSDSPLFPRRNLFRTCRVGEPLGTASTGQGWQPCPFPSQRLRPLAGHPSRRVPGSPSERIPQRLRPLAGL